MALNNNVIEIPQAETLEERLAYVISAFASASGISADENNVFWVNTTKTLGITFKVVSNYIHTYSVNTTDDSFLLDTGNGITVSSNAYLIYNQSAKAGSVFAFVLNNNKTNMNAAICKDESGNALIAAFSTVTSFRVITDSGYVNVPLANPRCNAPTFSMVKMPTILKPVAFEGLFLIVGSPSVSYDFDAGIYVGGSLYKIMEALGTQDGAAMAFKV